MDSALKWALGIGAAAGGGLLFRKFFTLSDLSGNLIIETGLPRIHQIKFGLPPTLVLAADVIIKNDSRGTVKVKHPMVSVYATEADLKANSPLASSIPEDKDYTIPKSGQVKFDAILIPVSALTVGNLVSKAFGQGGLELWVRKGTIIGNVLPFRSDEKKTFKM